jgi:hypothetical protein
LAETPREAERPAAKEEEDEDEEAVNPLSGTEHTSSPRLAPATPGAMGDENAHSPAPAPRLARGTKRLHVATSPSSTASPASHGARARAGVPVPPSPTPSQSSVVEQPQKRLKGSDAQPVNVWATRMQQRRASDAGAAASPIVAPGANVWKQRMAAAAAAAAAATTAAAQSQQGVAAGRAPRRLSESERLHARQKQIALGKATVGYQRYTTLVSHAERGPQHPRTPDPKQSCSKRSWDGQVRKWRRALHRYDPEGADAGHEEEEAEEEDDEEEEAQREHEQDGVQEAGGDGGSGEAARARSARRDARRAGAETTVAAVAN